MRHKVFWDFEMQTDQLDIKPIDRQKRKKDGHPCNEKWIVGSPEEMGPATRTAGSHLAVALEKLISPQSTHTQTNVNMRGSH